MPEFFVKQLTLACVWRLPLVLWGTVNFGSIVDRAAVYGMHGLSAVACWRRHCKKHSWFRKKTLSLSVRVWRNLARGNRDESYSENTRRRRASRIEKLARTLPGCGRGEVENCLCR